MNIANKPKWDSDAWTDSQSVFDDTAPYPSGARSSLAGLSSEYSFNPHDWGLKLSPDLVESDDDLHTAVNGANLAATKNSVSLRGIGNTGCLVTLCLGLLVLFIGYPVITFYGKTGLLTNKLASFNASGQVPQITGNHGLIDFDTPKSAYTKLSWEDGTTEMQLVFSDEFNTEGRSFYPGDDPYWEAVDLYYWGTGDLEWYDPEAVTTANGSLVLTISQKQTHGLNYEGGMLSTWNKFCFTGGLIETSVQLPGANNVLGFWPAIWTMGNLGRVGYGATLEGLWPYTYDSCDVGTVANQSVNGIPVAATVNGDPGDGGALSYLPGQRLSRCTCPGESHPGPKHSDGTFFGRAAPEIDIFEAQIQRSPIIPEVSQSAQWAPFDAGYAWFNTSDNMIIVNPRISKQNPFVGSATQQASSVVTKTDSRCYELAEGCYSVYGFEYQPGFDDGYITWISNNKTAWTLKSPGLGPDPTVEISQRPIAQEPMYIIANLGMSRGFTYVDFAHLTFPSRMMIDYVRVYQPKKSLNIGCNPTDFPTENYINSYIDAYTNPNLTTWVDDYQQEWPKNSFLGQC